MSRSAANCLTLIRAAFLCALFFTVFSRLSPKPHPRDTPVGHWVAEHTSNGGIGSWWDFRSDGTLTMQHRCESSTSPITRFERYLHLASCNCQWSPPSR